MSLTVEEFLNELTRLGIMPVSAASKETVANDATELAERLVEQKRITSFQAAEILGGRTDRLRMGAYLLVEELGQGGMGHVYLAEHSLMRRRVALKVIASHLINNPDIARRFEREVRTLAQLSHPNIVAAFDAGQVDGEFYLVMELVEGVSLRERLTEHGPIDPPQALEMVRQTLKGLAYAHDQGVVHRDIKPGNLVRSESGDLKILDLGLARILEQSDETCTAAGQLLGTAGYMAPEQAAGQEVDHRVDLYALGRTWRDLVLGIGAESGQDDALRQRLTPGEFAIYSQMVAARCEDRFATAHTALAAIDSLVEDDEDDEDASSTAGMDALPPIVEDAFDFAVASKDRRRWPARVYVWAGGITLAAMLLALLAFPDRSRPAVLEQPPATLDGHDSGEPTFVLFTSDSRLMLTGGWDGQVVVWEVANRRRLWTEPKPREIGTREPFGLVSAVLLDDDTKLVAGDSDGMIRLWELNGSQLRASGVVLPARSNDSSQDTIDIYLKKISESRFASATEDGVARVWDVAAGGLQLFVAYGDDLSPEYRLDVMGIESTPGALLVSHSDTVRWDYLDDRTVPLHGLPENTGLLHYQQSHDLLFIGTTSDLVAWKLSSNDEQFRVRKPHAVRADWEGGPWAMACSPDGRHLATGGDDGVIALWNTSSGTESQRVAFEPLVDAEYQGPPLDDINALAFSPDGRWLAAACTDGNVRIWRFAN